MKKARKLGLQSLALVLMAFVLVAGVAFGMTGAWFTAGHQGTEQTLTFGEVTINVTDNGIHAYRQADYQNSLLEDPVELTAAMRTDSDVMPGDEIVLDLTMEKAANSENFYYKVVITVTDENNVLTSANKAAIEDQSVAPKLWTAGDGNLSVHFTLAGNQYGDAVETKSFVINYTIYAIQEANLTLAQATAAMNDTNYTFSAGSYTGTGLFTIA